MNCVINYALVKGQPSIGGWFSYALDYVILYKNRQTGNKEL